LLRHPLLQRNVRRKHVPLVLWQLWFPTLYSTASLKSRLTDMVSHLLTTREVIREELSNLERLIAEICPDRIR